MQHCNNWYTLVVAILIACLVVFSVRNQTFLGTKPTRWLTAAKLIGANEYNRVDGIKTARVCREKCTMDEQCLATEYIRDEYGSGTNSCIFYNHFDSSLRRPTKATDHTSGVWIKA